MCLRFCGRFYFYIVHTMCTYQCNISFSLSLSLSWFGCAHCVVYNEAVLCAECACVSGTASCAYCIVSSVRLSLH